jgi:lipopolysaccharide transport system permease protein
VEKEKIHEIQPRRGLLDINLKEVWRYRDLMLLFVRRDFVSVYKQTVLGPAWFFIQPIFTTLIFTFVFGNVGKFSPEGKPTFLYYLAGIVLWQYFAECLKKTSTTFITNKDIFGKVYYPRLIMPFSIVLSSLLKLGVQLLLFIVFYVIAVFSGTEITMNASIALFPLLIILMAGMGTGFGLLVSAMTTKYRDLKFLLVFGVQLLMYITPGIIMSYGDFIKNMPDYAWVFRWNPIGPVIETFKHATLDAGTFSPWMLLYSIGFTLVLMFLGIIVFNKTEQNFMDTV